MKNFSLLSIYKRYKWKMSATFMLLILENISKFLQPLFLGFAINDLLKNELTGLWQFCILYAIGFIFGVIRRFYDTRAYTRIYTEIASKVVNHQNEKNTPISTISARSTLLKELIDFFEYDVPQGFTSLIGVVGAVVMLGIFNLWIFAGCIVSIILILIIYSLSQNNIWNLNTNLNDELEYRINIFESKNNHLVFSHFKNISKWMVKLSDLETLNFGLIEIILFGLAIFGLYISATTPNIAAGTIFSTLTYILEFSNGIFMLPILFQQLIRLKEISSRLEKI